LRKKKTRIVTMEEVFDAIPAAADLFSQGASDGSLELFPDNDDEVLYEPAYDLLSDEMGSAMEQSCVSSSPASPHNAADLQLPVANEDFSGHAMQASSPVIKSEPIETSEYEPPIKRERVEETPVPSPRQEQGAMFPDMSNPASYLQTLAKGRSEDIDMFRNMLRCHGGLTPDIDKQLRHLSRQVKNRESAQISRKRKREYVELLRNALVKMHSVDTSLRTSLAASQTESAQKSTEADLWHSYARNLQRLLQEHGIEVPKEPVIPVVVPVQIKTEPEEDPLPEALFDGPCGFGHMSAPKPCPTKRRSSRAEKRQKQ